MKPLTTHATKLNSKKRPKIVINKKLDRLDDSPLFNKKMKKGAKMFSIAGLPKVI